MIEKVGKSGRRPRKVPERALSRRAPLPLARASALFATVKDLLMKNDLSITVPHLGRTYVSHGIRKLMQECVAKIARAAMKSMISTIVSATLDARCKGALMNIPIGVARIRSAIFPHIYGSHTLAAMVSLIRNSLKIMFCIIPVI